MSEPQTLFTAKDLTDWLKRPVSDESAAVAERVVWGWLRPVLKLEARPNEITPEQFAWAIELGGIAFANPEGLAEYQLEEERSKYSSERRDEILLLAGNGGLVPTGGVPAPTGRFPKARAYPDPAERCW